MSVDHADVTAVVLNYARLDNVRVIAAHLCSDQLRDTISNVIVWNNSDRSISVMDIDVSPPGGMLRVINAPQNYYFQARFLACIEAPTDWCFVQDDDYLVSAEAIRALRRYSKQNQSAEVQYPIHLLPPHEHLSATIRVRTTEKYVASFAWLGHGTLLTKMHAQSFIDLLRRVSDDREDVMKMADNFFSILFNRRAEIWIDPGKHFEAGRDDAFTIGAEGNERNWRYIELAEQYLERITSHPELFTFGRSSVFPKASPLGNEAITRAPALTPGHTGLWSTNIPLLPPNISVARFAGSSLRSIDRICQDSLSDTDRQRYMRHNLACIGDGLASTVFQSPAGCREGEWLQFDFLNERTVSTVTFEWEVELGFAQEIRSASYAVLERGQNWVSVNSEEISPLNEKSFVVRFKLNSPRCLVAVRAVAGAGSNARAPWAIKQCVVQID